MNHKFGLCSLLLLTACASLPPERPRPSLEPQTWISSEARAIAARAAGARDPQHLGWRQYFRSPALQKLIADALSHNHDLRRAALNVQMVQAQYTLAQGGAWPTLGSSASFQRARQSAARSPIKKAFSANLWQVGLGVPAYELDLFGKVRAQNEAAAARYFAAQSGRDAAQIALIAAVAKTAFQARYAVLAEDLSQRALAAQERILRLVQRQFRAGLVDALVLAGLESQMAQEKSALALQQEARTKALAALALLVGHPVSARALPELDAEALAGLKIARKLPAAILENRPDIRQALAALSASSYDLAAARAAFFPSITLTTNAGFESLELQHLFEGGHFMWQFLPKVSLPLFDGGRLRANLSLRETQQALALENYRQTVEKAFSEVNSALLAQQTLATAAHHQRELEAAALRAQKLQALRLRSGVGDAQSLANAQHATFLAQKARSSGTLQVLLNRVDLYTTLGGGLAENIPAEHP